MIQPLAEEIRKNTFVYKQVEKRENIGYIYAQYMGDKIIAYEVFKHMVNTMFNCVSFPGSSVFGIWAWSCSSLEKAK